MPHARRECANRLNIGRAKRRARCGDLAGRIRALFVGDGQTKLRLDDGANAVPRPLAMARTTEAPPHCAQPRKALFEMRKPVQCLDGLEVLTSVAAVHADHHLVLDLAQQLAAMLRLLPGLVRHSDLQVGRHRTRVPRGGRPR
jgi:hypothetical protein